MKVGLEHQAVVPDYSPNTPYSMASKALDHLVWTPRGTSDGDGKCEQVSGLG